MGSFIGHALPGSFFMIFSAWWIIRAFMAFYKSYGRHGEPFRCSVTFPPRLRRHPNLDIEALVISSACGIGIFVEIVAACFLRGLPVGMTNMQHATMYFFFGCAALSSLIAPRFKPYIQDVDNFRYIMLLMAYIAEATLFKFHLFGRVDIDVLVHTLLLYTVYAAILATCIEMYFTTNLLSVMARSFATMLQGTWFWQAGFILYNPFTGTESWKEDHHHMMLIAAIFTWHMAVILITMIIVGVVIATYYRRQGNSNDFAMHNRPNGYVKLSHDIEGEMLSQET